MTNELTIRQTQAVMPFETMNSMATVFHQSGMFPDIKSAAQALVKIQAGSELGFSPIYSMTKIYIVKSRVMVSAEALGAMVKRSGRYDYKIIKLDNETCELEFTDNGKAVYLSRFTMQDARTAGIISDGSGWQKWPRAMLMSKALSQGARAVCPHVIAGTYTPEDMGYSVNPETDQLVPETPEAEIESRKPETGRPSLPPEVKDKMEQAVAQADGKEPPKEHWCAEHNTAFFKKGGMKGYAHPIGTTGKWCNEPKQAETTPELFPEEDEQSEAAGVRAIQGR